MKKNSCIILLYLITNILTTQSQQAPERNPFEFKQEQALSLSIPDKNLETPSKWTIKENGKKLIIIENSDDGQVRTIEAAPLAY